jgi:hypothetical protein
VERGYRNLFGYQDWFSDESSACSILPLGVVGIVMKLLIFAVYVVFAFGGVSAQKPLWQPSPGHTQVPIWPGRVPDPQPVAGPEFAETTAKPWMDTGRPATGVVEIPLVARRCAEDSGSGAPLRRGVAYRSA